MSALESIRNFFEDAFDRLFGRARRPLALVATATTDRGLVRADNQDSFCSLPESGLLAVADGMGGGDGGALASQWTCEALAAAARTCAAEPLAAREARAETALQEVNERIRVFARENGYKSMGTTVVLLLLDLENGFCARICHIGDSRLYRFRNGRLDLLTRDHTVGNELGSAMSAGSAERARALQARSNPLTHILTRAVGTLIRARSEWKTVDVQRGDRFLLCSDGVHDMLDDASIGALLKASTSPRDAVARLADAVRVAGAGDNYTILCAWAVTRRGWGRRPA